MNSCLNMAPNTSSLNMDPKTAFQSHDSFEETADQFSNAELNSETILNYSLSRSAYDEATLSNTNGSDSIDTFYDASTTVNSCMHNASISPLTAQENLLNLGLSGKGLHIGHLNIQGIRSGEKVDQIKIMLHSSTNNICMLGLSESKLGDDIPDGFLSVENFQCFRKDKRCGAGGLLVYVRNDVVCNRRKDLEDDNFESLWLDLQPKNSKSFLVGHFYRNPQSTILWNETFEDQLERVMNDDKEIFILGDFNKDLLNSQVNKNWTDYMYSQGLIQHVNKPTRVVSNRSSTLIDHVYSNFSDNIKYVDVPKIGLSDHYPIFLTRKISMQVTKITHHTIKYRSFKKFEETKFIEDLQAIPWDVVNIFEDVDDALETWYSLLFEVIDKHIPLKHHRVKRKNQPTWLTTEIIEGIKVRDRFKALGNQEQYKVWRNKVVSLIKQSKKCNYEKLIEEGKNQPTTIWKIFNELNAGKQKNGSSNKVNSVKLGNSEIYNSDEIANTFNDFFINIAKNLKEPVPLSDHMKLKDYCNNKLPDDISFDMPLLNKDKVLKFLNGLDESKSTGTDDVGPRLLKMAAPFVADSLTYICNLSIKTSTFPDKWKEAKVKPLHKAGPTNDMNNFRPISILPTLSKIIEKHAHDSLLNFLESHKLLHNTQSGFRPNHSCETALVHMTDMWLQALDRSDMVGVIFIDFRKAFDLVDHKILLKKMSIYKMNQQTLGWFSSYLTCRTQRVCFGNDMSNNGHIKYGVPQGSILGPLLFLLFINDLPLHTDVFTDLYADDTTLYEMNSSRTEIETRLQGALSDVAQWCRLNGMVINMDKTKTMIVTTKQKRARIDDSLHITLFDKPLSLVSSEKVLGVQVDNNLSWTDHVSKVSKKMSTNIWLLSKIKRYLSVEHRVLFYKSYVQPHLDYGNIVWGNAAKTNLLQLERLQRRACRVILNYNVDDVYQSMNNLKIMSFSERVFLRKAKFMFKVSNSITPDYINSMFTKRQPNDDDGNESRMLRSIAQDNFVLPKPKTESYKNSMAFSGSVVWNCLTKDIKMAPSSESFHSRCVKWMKS